MSILYQFPGGSAGQTAYNAATPTTGAGQTVAYSTLSALAAQPGDVVFGVNNVNNNYLEMAIVPSTTRFRSRFYVNPVGLTFGANEQFNITLFRGTSFGDRTHRIYIGNSSSVFGVIPLSYAEGNTSPVSSFVAVTKAKMLIEEEFVRSSAFGVTNAVYTVWVNGTQIYQRTGFANYTSFGLVNKVWFGGVGDIDAGTSGIFQMGKLLITDEAATLGGVVWPSTFTLALSVGDSLVNGSEDWPALSDPLHVIREGVASQTLVDQIEPNFATHLAAHPTVDSVILEGGINDINHSYTLLQMQNAMVSMILQSRDAGKAIAVAEIAPYKAHANWTSGRQIILDDYNTWLNTLGLPVIAAYATMEDPGTADTLLAAYDIGDGLHFNLAGMRALGAQGSLLYNGPVPQGTVFLLATETDYAEFIKLNESGQSQAWDGSANLGALSGGIRFTITTTNKTRVDLDFKPAGSQELFIRHRINADSLTMANNDNFTISRLVQVSSTTTLWAVRLLQQGGVKYVAFAEYDDNGYVADRPPVLIGGGPHSFDCIVTKSSGVSDNNAIVRFVVDGVVSYESSAVDLFTLVNGPYTLRFGGELGIDVGTSGSFAMGGVLIKDNASLIAEGGGFDSRANFRLGLW